MSALVLLIGFSLLVALTFLGLFLWALRTQQYRDTCTPALRILFDESPPLHDPGEEEK
jgi:cbb3-type cytochrome oxidase maturation protein